MKKIAVLSTYLAETHARQVLSGILKCAEENDCCIYVFTCKMRYDPNNRHDVGEYMIFDMIDYSLFDAVIIAGSTIWSEALLKRVMKKISESGLPAVSLEKYTPDMMNVVIDNKEAMKDLILHMINVHGYRRINYIAGVPGNAEAIARHQAFVEALEENGIEYDPRRVFWGNWLKSSGEEAVEAFDSSGLPFPEAIVCSSDKNALGAYAALTKMGLSVPQDVALTGFDDDFEGKYHVPALTTVARMPEQSGYMACEAVLRGMSEEDKGSTIAIETSSVFRESCGCVNKQRLQEKQFRKLYFQNLDTNEKLIRLLDDISIDLTAVSTFKELQTVLEKHVSGFGCDSFYLSIYDSVLETGKLNIYSIDFISDGFHDCSGKGDCTLAFGYHNSKIIDERVKRAQLRALLKQESHGGGCYVVSPVHFGDKFFGFSILGNSTLPFESELYYTLMTNIGNAVQSIKTQQFKQLMIEELESVWSFDSLTGVYNREGFKKYGGRVWDESVKKRANIMMLFADLDGLKKINDTYGHDEGDRYIRALADIFKSARHHGEVIMRYGGDEFVVISSDVTEEYAKAYVQEIQRCIEEYNAKRKGINELSASVGYFLLNPTEENLLDEAIFKADKEMYHIKKSRSSEACKNCENISV